MKSINKHRFVPEICVSSDKTVGTLFSESNCDGCIVKLSTSFSQLLEHPPILGLRTLRLK